MPLAARLIDAGRPIDVVSPAGLASTLCSLAPVTSESAARQIIAATGIVCPHFRGYVPTAIWLRQGAAYDPGALGDLRRHAAVVQGRPPFNAAIAEWTQRRGGVPVRIDVPVKFAAVSALVYSRPWEFAVPRLQSRRRTFHGRDRASTVTFIAGVGARVQRDDSCERTSIPLEYGGTLRLAKVMQRPSVTALSCLARPYTGSAVVYARYAMPRIRASGQRDLSDRLKRLGVADIFTRSKEPFRRLQRDLALDAVLQATEVQVDETGVGIRATTAAYTLLGLPPSKARIVYDVPFVFQVVDGNGTPVALGMVNDL
jgi:hypothetical protein